jgi:alpha-ketoglutarate-dependent taurine dioxygenase
MHPADSFELLTRLWAHAMRDPFIYSHEWRDNDLLIWNNSGTLHRARPYAASSGRLLHRFTLEGEEPIRAPQSSSPAPA